jgi:hypothetical protein
MKKNSSKKYKSISLKRELKNKLKEEITTEEEDLIEMDQEEIMATLEENIEATTIEIIIKITEMDTDHHDNLIKIEIIIAIMKDKRTEKIDQPHLIIDSQDNIIKNEINKIMIMKDTKTMKEIIEIKIMTIVDQEFNSKEEEEQAEDQEISIDINLKIKNECFCVYIFIF